MDGLPFWQLAAGTVAIVFVVIAVGAVIRLTRLATLILVMSLLGIPTAALATYAVNPQPFRSSTSSSRPHRLSGSPWALSWAPS